VLGQQPAMHTRHYCKARAEGWRHQG
jgi:hypothetical protein